MGKNANFLKNLGYNRGSSRGGEMVDALVLGTSGATLAGSSPVLGTNKDRLKNLMSKVFNSIVMTKSNKLIFIICTVLIFLTVFIWYNFIRDNTPQFFPFNETRGEYTIAKETGTNIFEVKYIGPNSFTSTENSDLSVTVIVGKSNVELEPYLGKKVMITKGEFQSGFTKQCIINTCIGIGGPYAAVIINEIHEVEH